MNESITLPSFLTIYLTNQLTNQLIEFSNISWNYSFEIQNSNQIFFVLIKYISCHFNESQLLFFPSLASLEKGWRKVGDNNSFLIS